MQQARCNMCVVLAFPQVWALLQLFSRHRFHCIFFSSLQQLDCLFVSQTTPAHISTCVLSWNTRGSPAGFGSAICLPLPINSSTWTGALPHILSSYYYYYYYYPNTPFLPRGKVRPADKLQFKASIFLPLVGLARSKQDPINRKHGAQHLYRPPPAGAYCL